jgi:hypothetical protein
VGRDLRHVTPGGGLVEVTNRTVQGRLLLRPGKALNEIVFGLLARGARRYGVQVCLFVALGNHYHLVLWVPDARAQAGFMCWFGANLAKEVNRLHNWSGPVWAGRYHSIAISQEEEAQVGRLRYILAHGAKEGLVASPREWPGVHCAQALLSDEPLEGVWFNRTREYAARAAGKEVAPRQFAEPEVLEWTPLPCWAHLPHEEYQERILEIVEEIEDATAARIRETGINPPGPAAIRAQDPRSRPNRSKKSPAPRFHAWDAKWPTQGAGVRPRGEARP